MRRLALLARIAFICNLFFAVCLLLQQQSATSEGSMISLAAILGLVLGMGIANPVSNLLNGLVLLRGHQLRAFVPRWLAIANLCFLVLQFVYIIHTWL